MPLGCPASCRRHCDRSARQPGQVRLPPAAPEPVALEPGGRQPRRKGMGAWCLVAHLLKCGAVQTQRRREECLLHDCADRVQRVEVRQLPIAALVEQGHGRERVGRVVECERVPDLRARAVHGIGPEIRLFAPEPLARPCVHAVEVPVADDHEQILAPVGVCDHVLGHCEHERHAADVDGAQRTVVGDVRERGAGRWALPPAAAPAGGEDHRLAAIDARHARARIHVAAAHIRAARERKRVGLCVHVEAVRGQLVCEKADACRRVALLSQRQEAVREAVRRLDLRPVPVHALLRGLQSILVHIHGAREGLLRHRQEDKPHHGDDHEQHSEAGGVARQVASHLLGAHDAVHEPGLLVLVRRLAVARRRRTRRRGGIPRRGVFHGVGTIDHWQRRRAPLSRARAGARSRHL